MKLDVIENIIANITLKCMDGLMIYLISRWLSVQYRRISGRETKLVVLAEVCGRVAGAADEDEVCHSVCYLICRLEMAIVWKSLVT